MRHNEFWKGRAMGENITMEAGRSEANEEFLQCASLY